jgi:hypothetical protein
MKLEKPKLFDEIIKLPRQYLRGFNRTPSKSHPLNPSVDKLFK